MENKNENLIRECQNCKRDFVIKNDDLIFYEKINVEIPSFCHECRLQRKLSWRNERTLYRRSCSMCDKSLISVFSEEKPFPIYCHSCFHGNNWNPLSYEMDVDFTKPFLEQFHELQKKVPRQYALVFDNLNCEYTNGVGFSKNCYLIFVSDHNEDCLYSYNIYYCRNCADLINCYNCELCYDLFNCTNCQKTCFSIDCKDSFDVYFSKDCVGCNNLIGCNGLRKKQYCIFNEQYTKEEYNKFVDGIDLTSSKSLNDIKEKFEELLARYPVKYLHGSNNVNVTGDNISNSKNAVECYSVKEIEDSKYIINGNKSKDSYECYVCVDNSELCYDSLGCFGTRGTIASHLPWSSDSLLYCDACESSSNLFGCVGLHHQNYCILNKQYTKEEYQVLKDKIIKHMKNMPYKDKMGRIYSFGEFFPIELSPYSYNETIANYYCPISKNEATKNNYCWKEPDNKNYEVTLKNENIPDKIKEVDDSIIDQIIECSHRGRCHDQCTKAFKITHDELQIYRKLNIPLPKMCHNCRFYQRLKTENPRKLWHRKCMKEGCTNEFETSYAPDRPEIIYCEKCYQQEVY